MSLIPLEKYKEIIDVLPILCVDIVARNTRGEILLVKRVNEPKKGEWWVIGGRVLKDETLEEAAVRKMKEEAGLAVRHLRPIGYFELLRGVNHFTSVPDYHTVSVVFETVIDDNQKVVLDKQSVDFKFGKKLPAALVIRPF